MSHLRKLQLRRLALVVGLGMGACAIVFAGLALSRRLLVLSTGWLYLYLAVSLYLAIAVIHLWYWIEPSIRYPSHYSGGWPLGKYVLRIFLLWPWCVTTELNDVRRSASKERSAASRHAVDSVIHFSLESQLYSTRALGWVLRERHVPSIFVAHGQKVTVNYRGRVEDSLSAGAYSSVAPNITSEHFPPEGGEARTVWIDVVHLGQNVTLSEAHEFIDFLGYRPATIAELLAFDSARSRYRDTSDRYVVALGPAKSSTYSYVPYVVQHQNRESKALGLHKGEDYFGDCCGFAAVWKVGTGIPDLVGALEHGFDGLRTKVSDVLRQYQRVRGRFPEAPNALRATILAKWLRSASVDARDDDGNTALIVVSQMGFVDCVKLLLNAGADVNARSSTGTTALIAAAAGGSTEVVQLLLNVGSDPRATNHEGKNAFETALQHGHTKVASVLWPPFIIWLTRWLVRAPRATPSTSQ